MPSDRSAETHSLPAAAYVILGMLRLGAETGYDVKKAVQSSTRFFWTISEAQIYPLLSKLEDLGLVEGRDASHGRRQRRAFRLNDEGEIALSAWLRRDEPAPFEVRDVALLKLFFGDAVGPDDGLALVSRLRSRSQAELTRLREQEGPAQELARATGNRFPALSLRAGIAVHEALVAAADGLERELVTPL